MAGIKIVTDSTADIPLGLAHELGIEVVPMYLHVGEQTFRAGLDITNDQFYQWMQDGRIKATTSSPPPIMYEQLYRRLTRTTTIFSRCTFRAGWARLCRAAQQAARACPHRPRASR